MNIMISTSVLVLSVIFGTVYPFGSGSGPKYLGTCSKDSSTSTQPHNRFSGSFLGFNQKTRTVDAEQWDMNAACTMYVLSTDT